MARPFDRRRRGFLALDENACLEAAFGLGPERPHDGDRAMTVILLVHGEHAAQRAGRPMSFPDSQIAAIRKGMRLVMGPGGTAGLSTLEAWDVGGKTGTAQNPHGEDHAWFVGWAAPRGEEPEIVAAMLLYFGQSGSQATSAPVMNAMNFYMNRRYDRPFDRYATPREKSRNGIPFDWAIVNRPVQDLPVYGYGEN